MKISNKYDHPSIDLLQHIFEYKDGILCWRNSLSKKYKAGTQAGMIDQYGYRVITLNYKPYRTHRLIFLMYHGYLPDTIDHIDGDRLNNKIENLRIATPAQNSRNCKVYSTNKTGYPNVFYVPRDTRWRARVSLDGKGYSIGCFDTPELANDAVLKFKLENFGEFIRSTAN